MSEYNITMLHRFASPGSGAALHLKENGDSLTMTKADSFSEWLKDDMKIITDSGPKTVSQASRQYLHYIIDCWMDDSPVSLQPSEL